MNTLFLLGPTGAGKTPFGELCEDSGLWGKRCAHFDFGQELRNIAAMGAEDCALDNNDFNVVVTSLQTGALLENENVRIARSILNSFIRKNSLSPDDLLILNGFPRHPGQALDIDTYLAVVAVVSLDCERDVVFQRIRLNTGGDRSGRTDDSPEEIERKLDLFRRRTAPLLEHYRRMDIDIYRINVVVDTEAQAIRAILEGNRPGFLSAAATGG